jgi:NAD(P)-dependent dehydrogenase (short-subunit alcohol dehydrogenase family)
MTRWSVTAVDTVIMASTIAIAGRLRGKAAIVTGAARGIGRATAIAFAREGADVMGIDIAGPVSSTLEVVPATPGALEETGRLVEAAGAHWCGMCLDQRDLTALRAAAEQARVAFGRLDILFANAGIQAFKPILDWEDADWRDQIDVNLTGTCNAIRAVAPYLVSNGGGRIIVTSSTQGRHGTKYGAAYSASKWGIIGLMKSAALGTRRVQDHRQRRYSGSHRHAPHAASAAVRTGRGRSHIKRTHRRAGGRGEKETDREDAARRSVDRARGSCTGCRIPGFR